MGREGFEPGDIQLQHELELHHPGQLSAIRVPVPSGGTEAASVRAAFEAEYNRLYGHVQPNGTIMVASLRLIARGSTGHVAVSGGERAVDAPRPMATRSVWYGAQGWLETPVYNDVDLRAGHQLAGPALVEAHTTTVLAGPGDTLWVDDDRNLLIDLAAVASAEPQRPSGAAGDVVRLDPIVLPSCKTVSTRSAVTWAGS